MKNIIIILCVISIYALASSCEKMFGDYLDKAPGVDVTSDTIFSSKVESEKQLAACYEWCLFNWYQQSDVTGDGSSFNGASDEAEAAAAWFWTNTTFNTGNVTATGYQTDGSWSKRWVGLRKANVYLENIDRVKGVDETYKTSKKAEVRFLRAFAYFEMFKLYGGVPIVKKSFLLTDNSKLQRGTLQETLDFILEDCDYAISNLPESLPSAERGHATKLAAMSLKSRALLYAASPLFNTSTPYLSIPGHNDLICFGNYDVNRWQLAAAAAKSVLDNAPAAGCALITNQGVTKNYKYMWETMNNAEVIFYEQSLPQCTFWYMLPVSMGGLQGNTVPFNFQKFYEKLDGTPQTWSMTGGDDLIKKYSELDPRFKQSIVGQNMDFNTTTFPKMQLTTVPLGRDVQGCLGGAWWKKPVPDAVQRSFTPQPVVNYPLFRLAEFYLNYAEALNEANIAPPQEAYDAVATVRARSGMPPFPAGMTKEQFRAKLQNEISVEYGYEDMRIFNIRRWLIAEREGVMKGKMYGIKIYSIAGNPNEYHYTPYVFEERSFFPKMYLNPFAQTEVDKGYLIQNPGY